ncbi:DUF3800 domain-containing protein [Sphingorhabdus sp.]|uniref:DUF3800 domain-containing protein n=1 Tax=Sphingorhabdus sp. TaxID=1902408 RepID=UPI003983A308
MPIYCDESGGVGRGVMTLAAVSIENKVADAVIARFREVTGLRGELKGSRIDLAERGLLFELLGTQPWNATVGIAISALAPEVGQDRGAHDTDIYAQLLNDAVAKLVLAEGNCVQIVIDDGRYGPETLALIRKDVAQSVGPCGTASLGLSHEHSGLQIADVIANTFFNRAMVTERQARLAAIVAPFLESGKIALNILSGDAQGDDERSE